ncbi:Hypothetical protein, predicted lipoprotein [Metamycoplasma auris 15026]|uniref:DUF31 domain-containing protein n=1 Tax=Metamycoplasma auris 15026 TaxID=1188233 RepID=N9TRW8_9BACT|nr:DUF31 family protein [Metamycoplasma auris]ENY68815.1 Hypothetical protein, predicted lipoprotein [Metamycoplasma auris 15026]
MKTIKKRKLIFPIFSIFSLSLPFFILSCEKNNKIGSILKENFNSNNKNDEKNSSYNKLFSSINLEDHFDLKIKDLLLNLKELTFLELQEKIKEIAIEPKNKNLLSDYDFKVNDITLENNSNQTNEAKINVTITNKNTKETKSFQYKLLNLKNENDSLNYPKSLNHIANKDEFFKKDNDEYIDTLKNHLRISAGINNWNEFRKDLKATSANLKDFNEKANKIGQDSYENLAFKGFSLPSYNAKNEVEGVALFEGNEIGKLPSLRDASGKADVYKTIGLARKIVNEKYLDIAKQTYSISLTRKNLFRKEISELTKNIEYWKNGNKRSEFQGLINQKLNELRHNKELLEQEWNRRIKENQESNLNSELQKRKEDELKAYDENIAYYSSHTLQKEIEILENKLKEFQGFVAEDRYTLSENGTMWILDYKLDEQGYPTKWYFGTNSHVARALNEDFLSFAITKINSNVSVGTTLNFSRLDDNITTFYFNDNKNAIKKVFDGVDYLKENPANFLIPQQKDKYKNFGAFADFAVFEIDFSKITKFSTQSNQQSVDAKFEFLKENNLAQNLAKEITNDYANQKDKHIKFKKNSYLKDYKKIAIPKNKKPNEDQEYLYAVGWPQSTGDFYFDRSNIELLEQTRINFSLWFNSEYEYFNEEIKNQNFNLKNKHDKGSFLSYNLGYRTFKNLPGLFDTFLAVPKFGDGFYELNGKKYINISLGYMPLRYAPVAGASGSSIRNQNNELVSIYYATNSIGRVGLSSAFRSEGFDYQGLYGKYNLPQYDLIYGGGKDQAKSYKDELKKLYGDSFKTNLFKNGLGKENPDFKFGNILSAKDLNN